MAHQIEFTGQELADIIAFAHDAKTQKTFTLKDVPEKIRAKIMSDDEDMKGMKKEEDKKMDGTMKDMMKKDEKKTSDWRDCPSASEQQEWRDRNSALYAMPDFRSASAP